MVLIIVIIAVLNAVAAAVVRYCRCTKDYSLTIRSISPSPSAQNFLDEEEEPRQLGGEGPNESKESGSKLGRFNISYLHDPETGLQLSDGPKTDSIAVATQ